MKFPDRTCASSHRDWVSGCGGQHAEKAVRAREAHSIAENIGVLDHDVALMDADAEIDACRGNDAGVTPSHRLLYLGRTAEGFYDAAKLNQKAIPCGLDQPTT